MKRACLFFFCILFLCSCAFAEPVRVGIGSYILNVGNYDPAFGSYDVTFYIWFRWDPGLQDFSAENFEFMNGKGVSLELVEEKPGYKLYRGEGSFFKKLDMTPFPFDSHEISIEVEDKLLTTDDLVYVPDQIEPSTVDPEISVLGWKTKTNKVEFRNIYYSTWNQTYSRYINKLVIYRSPIDAIKVFLPIIFLSLLGFFTFLVNIKHFSERLTLSVFTFMAAIAYQIQVNVTIPPLGFFTLADKAMISLYAGLLFASFYTIYIQRYEEKHQKGVADRTNKFAVSSYFWLQLVIFLAIVLLDYLF